MTTSTCSTFSSHSSSTSLVNSENRVVAPIISLAALSIFQCRDCRDGLAVLNFVIWPIHPCQIDGAKTCRSPLNRRLELVALPASKSLPSPENIRWHQLMVASASEPVHHRIDPPRPYFLALHDLTSLPSSILMSHILGVRISHFRS